MPTRPDIFVEATIPILSISIIPIIIGAITTHLRTGDTRAITRTLARIANQLKSRERGSDKTL